MYRHLKDTIVFKFIGTLLRGIKQLRRTTFLDYSSSTAKFCQSPLFMETCSSYHSYCRNIHLHCVQLKRNSYSFPLNIQIRMTLTCLDIICHLRPVGMTCIPLDCKSIRILFFKGHVPFHFLLPQCQFSNFKRPLLSMVLQGIVLSTYLFQHFHGFHAAIKKTFL